MGKLAVLTGCSGMDAKTLTHLLLAKDYHVVLTYRRNTQLDLEAIKNIFHVELFTYPLSKLTFEPCDIVDRNSVEECIKNTLLKYGKIDELYLLAAMSHVGNSFTQKEYSVLANGQSVYHFLETIKNCSKNTRVYTAMTSELAGNVPDGQVFNEDTAWNPKSPYSIGKALGGHWVRFYRESLDSGLFCCFGILFNHSNCYRTKDFAIRKITNTAARIVLGKDKELKLGHLQWARDEHFSDFGCEMMWKMLQKDTPTDYVVGNGDTHWGEEYVTEAFNYFNLDWRKYVKFDDNLKRPNEVVRLISDPSKAEKELGWIRNRISFQKHIELMCNYDFILESGEIPIRPDVFKLSSQNS